MLRVTPLRELQDNVTAAILVSRRNRIIHVAGSSPAPCVSMGSSVGRAAKPRFQFLLTLFVLAANTACNDFQSYRDVARACVDEFRARDEVITPTPLRLGVAQEYAYVMQARAILDGWDHPYVHYYLRALRRTQNIDGGYGLNAEWDAFGDGTLNPADTTYAVTLTDHVGMPLLAAFEADVVTREELRKLIGVLDRLPEVQSDCLAYSAARADQPPLNGGGCVINVNAGIAAFLSRAAAAGVLASEEHAHLLRRITDHTIYWFDVTTREWPYTTDANSHSNDVNHASYLVDAMQQLAPAFVAQHGLIRHGLTRYDYHHWGDWIGQQRLVQYDCFSVTWELLRAQSLLYDVRMTTLSYAQLALWAAKAHEHCE